MKAIIQDNEKLNWEETDTPTLRPGEVLLQVEAAGVNRGDITQTQGNYPPPKGETEILGLEAAGVVVDAGDTSVPVGTRAGALLVGGGYGEYVAVPEGQLTPIPEGFDSIKTAATVEAACTVWSNIAMTAGLKAGQRILIHGGAGGIGSFAIQIAKALGAEVAVTAGSTEKLATCKKLGADILINYKEEDFVEALKGSCDVILDIMGGAYLDKNMRCLSLDGHLVIIGVQGGIKAELSLGRMLPRRQSITAQTIRARDLEDKAHIVAETVENVWPMLADGRVIPQIHATLPIEEAKRAHELLDSGEVTGKIVLSTPQS